MKVMYKLGQQRTPNAFMHIDILSKITLLNSQSRVVYINATSSMIIMLCLSYSI